MRGIPAGRRKENEMLKAVVENIEGMAPELVEHYVERDGKHFLAVESIDGLELSDARGLKSALSKEKENAKALKKSLDLFGDLDPDKAREALGKMDEYLNWTPDEKTREANEAFEKKITDKLEKERKKQTTKFEEEQGKLTTRNTVLEKELYNTKINMVAHKAIVDAGGEPEFLMHKVTSAMQIREENGKFEVVIVNDAGEPKLTSTPGEYGSNMTVDQFVAELKEIEVLAPAFKGSGASGSGATNSSSVISQGAHTITQAELSDFPTYKRKRKAAEDAGVQLRPIP